MFRQTTMAVVAGLGLAACSDSASTPVTQATSATTANARALTAQGEVTRTSAFNPGPATMLTSGAATYAGALVGNATIDRVNRVQVLGDLTMEFGLGAPDEMVGTLGNLQTVAADGTIGSLGGTINLTAGGVTDTFVARGSGQLTRDGAVAPANTIWTLNGQARVSPAAGAETAVTGGWNVSTLGAINGFQVDGTGNFYGLRP